MMNLYYLIDRIMFKISRLFELYHQKDEAVTDDPPVKIYVNEIQNRITYRIKTGYYLKLLTPKTMKLLGSTKSKITKDGNGKNVPHLEIIEVVLVHCNIVNNGYQQNSRVLYTFIVLYTCIDLLINY